MLGPSDGAFATWPNSVQGILGEAEGGRERKWRALSSMTTPKYWAGPCPTCLGQQAEIRRAPDARRKSPSGPQALRQVAGTAVGPDPSRELIQDAGTMGLGHRPQSQATARVWRLPQTASQGLCHVYVRAHTDTRARAQTQGCTHTHPQANATWSLGTCPCLQDQERNRGPEWRQASPEVVGPRRPPAPEPRVPGCPSEGCVA